MESEIMMFAYQRLRKLSNEHNENRINADAGLRRHIIDTMRDDTFEAFKDTDPTVIQNALRTLAHRLVDTM